MPSTPSTARATAAPAADVDPVEALKVEAPTPAEAVVETPTSAEALETIRSLVPLLTAGDLVTLRRLLVMLPGV